MKHIIRSVLSIVTTMFCVWGIYYWYEEPLFAQSFSKEPLLIIFSKDRPLQLYALLESIEKNVRGYGNLAVLYHAANDRYDTGYKELMQRFPRVIWYPQSRDNPRNDFKNILLRIIDEHASDYVIFAVDDMVATLPVDLRTMSQKLDSTGAYGFYLRLGEHVDTCFMMGAYSGVPPLSECGDNVCAWRFATGRGDWRYPHTTDMTLYRTKDILHALKNLRYHSPNSLEAQWSGYYVDLDRKGICYKSACVVNIPLNLVQKDFPRNRTLALYTVEQLHEIFAAGKKIDIRPLMNARYSAPHIQYEPTFISR